MHPVIAVFQLPILDWVIELDWYPFMHLVGFGVLVGLTLWLYRRDVGPPLPVLDVLVVGVAAGVVGARVLGAWTAGDSLPNLLTSSPEHWWRGNKSAYGGLLAGIAAGTLTAWLRGIPVRRFLDAAAPAVALATVCARIGCFLGGCCYGVPTHSFLGLHFPEGHAGMERLVAAGDPRGLHPTQLYLAGSALLIAAVVLGMRRRGVGRPGDRFLVAAGLYAASVFGIEFLRGDTQRYFAAGLSHSQWISLAALAALLAALVVRSVRVPLRTAAATGALVGLLAAGAPPARAQDGAPDGGLESAEILVQALATQHPGAADALASLLELGDGRLATWSRLGLGAEAALRGDVDGAVKQWRAAAEIEPGTAWAAQGELTLGLGLLMQGQRAPAAEAFRRAAASGDANTIPVAEVSLGRLLAAAGDHAGAEQSFRRVFDAHPRALVADDAASGLARALAAQGRNGDARGVLAEAAQRYERRGRYMNAGRDPTLRWDRIGRLGPERVGELLRERVAQATARGRSPLGAVLSALTDRWAAPDLQRLRKRLARRRDRTAGGPTGAPSVTAPVPAAAVATAPERTTGSQPAPARPADRPVRPIGLAALAALLAVGLVLWRWARGASVRRDLGGALRVQGRGARSAGA